MEKIFLTKLEIKKVRHLENISIGLSDKELRHLIFTGKNGSGKTSVLDAVSEYLNSLGITFNPDTSPVKVFFNTPFTDLFNEYTSGNYLLAYYRCDRYFHAEDSEHIEKVSLNDTYALTDAPRDQFVKYLADLKVTAALARTGGTNSKADIIDNWFEQFEKLLQQIFEDTTLKLKFNEDTFLFTICQNGREPFEFNYMSSGFSAVMDIVSDLMMRMAKKKEKIFLFDLPGIVLIDEIETHLHLELQKQVLKILTTLFPNIQFIVSTHSPFILNSLANVVIFDLENRTFVNQKNGLTDLPYDGIVKGYFRVDTLSYDLKKKFQEYKLLVQKTNITDDDLEQIAEIEMYLDEIPDYLALDLTTEYQRLKIELEQREDI